MTYIQPLGDLDAPTDADGNVKFERRGAAMQPAREQVSTLPDGKVRPINVVTGDIIEPTVSAKTGKVNNKNRIGRGKVEYDFQLALEAVAAEDSEGRALRIVHQRLGVDGNPESPTYGQDITQFRIQWMPKRPMTPAARAGLNRRILQAQSEAINERAKELAARKTPINQTAHALAVAKLEASKARVQAEAKPADEKLAAAFVAAKAKVKAADEAFRTARSSENGDVVVTAKAPAAGK